MDTTPRPVVQLGESHSFDEGKEATQPSPEEHVSIMVGDFVIRLLRTSSFRVLVQESLELALADFKLSMGQKLADAVINSLDFDDIANDAISDSNLQSEIASSVSDTLDEAVRRAF